MLKYLLFLSFILTAQNAIAQEYDCGWYGNKTVEQRNTIFPFNKTKKVLIVSHLLSEELTGKGVMELTVADESDNIIRTLDFETDGVEHHLSVKEEVQLNEGWKNFLSHVLVNYTLKENPGDSYAVSSSGCFEPRNSILFMDENDTIICCLEVCFTCRGTTMVPDPAGLNQYADVKECHPRLDQLLLIFKKNGITYGIE